MRGHMLTAGFSLAFLLALPWLGMATPAGAQGVDEMQRCIWRCLADSPGAGSSRYNACVKRMCENPNPPAPQRSGWRHVGKPGGGQMASITTGYSTLAYVCQRRKPAVLGIDGLPGPASAVSVSVDGKAYRAGFATQGNTHYTVIPPGSALLRAILAGNTVQFRNPAGRSTSSFSLSGSGKAIRAALSNCGLAP